LAKHPDRIGAIVNIARQHHDIGPWREESIHPQKIGKTLMKEL
jgi:hypothetical protein